MSRCGDACFVECVFKNTLKSSNSPGKTKVFKLVC
uniref:Uncharacterized protein n=1 Tax=Gloeochaete wittrockiana TaxID=38269 RepID=A0A3G1IVW8_9EUKA|nr:hypothetical protein [Gloeochaete wittrockiana]ASQ40195.1 hypothetical protein [Gloeochaete wittrockiana]